MIDQNEYKMHVCIYWGSSSRCVFFSFVLEWTKSVINFSLSVVVSHIFFLSLSWRFYFMKINQVLKLVLQDLRLFGKPWSNSTGQKPGYLINADIWSNQVRRTQLQFLFNNKQPAKLLLITKLTKIEKIDVLNYMFYFWSTRNIDLWHFI